MREKWKRIFTKREKLYKKRSTEKNVTKQREFFIYTIIFDLSTLFFLSLFPLSLHALPHCTHSYVRLSLVYSLTRSYTRQQNSLTLYIDHQSNVSATINSPLVRNRHYTANINEVKRERPCARNTVREIFHIRFFIWNANIIL